MIACVVFIVSIRPLVLVLMVRFERVDELTAQLVIDAAADGLQGRRETIRITVARVTARSRAVWLSYGR